MRINGDIIFLENETIKSTLVTTPNTTLVIKGDVAITGVVLQGSIKMHEDSDLDIDKCVLSNLNITQPTGTANSLSLDEVIIKEEVRIDYNIRRVQLGNTDTTVLNGNLRNVQELFIYGGAISNKMPVHDNIYLTVEGVITDNLSEYIDNVFNLKVKDTTYYGEVKGVHCDFYNIGNKRLTIGKDSIVETLQVESDTNNVMNILPDNHKPFRVSCSYYPRLSDSDNGLKKKTICINT